MIISDNSASAADIDAGPVIVAKKSFGGSSARLLWLLLGAIMLVGSALRLYHLDAQSLWMDEVSSLRNARAFGYGGIFALARVDQVAPLHSIVLWLATIIGGDGAVSLRMPSVLAGIVTIALTYMVAVRLFANRWIGVLAAALVAVSPYAIWYAQEGRMYALLLMCAMIVTFLSLPVTHRALRSWELVALTAATTVGYGMHHYMALLSAALALYLIVEGNAFKRRAWAWVVTQGVAFIIFLGWLYLTRDRLGNTAGTEKPSFLLWVPYTFYTYIVGFSFGPSTREIQTGGAALVPILKQNGLGIVLAGMSALIVLATALRRAFQPDLRSVGRLLLIWLVMPICIAILVTRFTNIRYNVRYVIVSFPALMLLFALAIEGVAVDLMARRGRSGLPVAPGAILFLQAAASMILVGCMLLSTYRHFTSLRYAKEDARSLASTLEQVPVDTLVVTDNGRVTKVLGYYSHRVIPEQLQVDYRFESHSPERIWRNLVMASEQRQGQILLIQYRSWESDPHHFLRQCLDALGSRIADKQLPGIEMTFYPRITADRMAALKAPRCR
jgi:uncharacterized membrane protein